MSVPALDASTVIEPIRQLAQAGGAGVLCVICGVDGPSYRPLGAMMAVLEDGTRIGTLSSGCVESDIGLHALQALQEGALRSLRYGKGSPFGDIVLPCGGGLDIVLVPRPDPDVLQALLHAHSARAAVALEIDPRSGSLRSLPARDTGWEGDAFCVGIEPEIRFLIFGKGPETASFAGLVQAAGYPNLVLSPDEETLAALRAVGCAGRHLTHAHYPEGLAADSRTAVVLFFHDHDWEPPIASGALATPAFYVGAQGSQRAAAMRRIALVEMGVAAPELARLKGPIGLVPSARDARMLAVSVLAEVLSEA